MLAELDRGDDDGALHLLEMQRSLLFSELVELRINIDAADRMIGRFRQGKQAPDWDEIFDWTEGLKRTRALRANWRDHWNFDRQAETHDDVVLGSGPEPGAIPDYARTLRTVADWVAPRPGERGLDIGTGTGNLAGLFLEKGIEMAGIDQSKEMLRRCRSKFPSMETKLGNVLAIPFLDRSFDFAVSSFALRHLSEEQLPLALEEIRRVLKPHGTLCIADLMVDRVEPDTASQPFSHAAIADLSLMTAWLEQAGYMVQVKRLSGLVQVVYAVPIRAGR
ncbi:methyltransferase domain-containing protein [Cohnella zeiphila]|uniref:methyltransferase domain-containing protein n=1 Tax=Cohnella zeiphila TaxID=2761120 RepID=UPI00192DEB8C